MNITKKFIITEIALNNILCTNHFNYLKSQILDSEEIELNDNSYNIIYINGKNFKYNIYTNIEDDSQFKWIGIFNDKTLIGLQLISITDNIELIVAEKHKSNICIFKEILEFTKQFNKDIITFPLNDKLKLYYKSFGFKDYKQGYIKYEKESYCR